LLLAKHELSVGEVIFEETRRVFIERFGVSDEKADEIEGLLRQRHVETVPESGPPVEVRDPDDKIVLALAIAAGEKILIIGDKDLRDVADQVDALRITTPRTSGKRCGSSKKASRRQSVEDAYVR